MPIVSADRDYPARGNEETRLSHAVTRFISYHGLSASDHGIRSFVYCGELVISDYTNDNCVVYLVAERSRFSPRPKAGILDYQLPNSRSASCHGDRIRPERHKPRSIATLRVVLARSLLLKLATVRSVALEAHWLPEITAGIDAIMGSSSTKTP
jgi:hypothetical protein